MCTLTLSEESRLTHSMDHCFVGGPRHSIHSVPSGYAAYVNQVLALLGIDREHLDWRQHAAWRPY
jgi:hypothetical protein